MASRTPSAVLRRSAAAAILLVVLPACVRRHCLCDDPEINPPNPGHDGRDSANLAPLRGPAYDSGLLAACAWSVGSAPKEKTP